MNLAIGLAGIPRAQRAARVTAGPDPQGPHDPPWEKGQHHVKGWNTDPEETAGPGGRAGESSKGQRFGSRR